MTITIWRPVAVAADRARKRTPDVAVIVRLDPVAIGGEIFAAPNVLVVILIVVLESLREVALAVSNPIVNRIE